MFSITTDKKQKFEENSKKEILQNTISIFEQLKKKKDQSFISQRI